MGASGSLRVAEDCHISDVDRSYWWFDHVAPYRDMEWEQDLYDHLCLGLTRQAPSTLGWYEEVKEDGNNSHME